MKKEFTEENLIEEELMEERGTSLIELFDELDGIYETLSASLSTLAVLVRGADSPEMAEALDLLWGYMNAPVDALGSLTAIGRRAVAGSDLK